MRTALLAPVLILAALIGGPAAPAAQRGPSPADLAVARILAMVPRDFPMYSKAEVWGAGPLPGGAGHAVILRTAESQFAVAAFFKRELPGRGWSVTQPRFNQFVARKAGRTLTVAIQSSGSGSRVTVAILR